MKAREPTDPSERIVYWIAKDRARYLGPWRSVLLTLFRSPNRRLRFRSPEAREAHDEMRSAARRLRAAFAAADWPAWERAMDAFNLAWKDSRVAYLIPLARKADKSARAAPKAGKKSAEVRGAAARDAIKKIVPNLVAKNVPRRDWVNHIAPQLKVEWGFKRSDRQIRGILKALGH